MTELGPEVKPLAVRVHALNHGTTLLFFCGEKVLPVADRDMEGNARLSSPLGSRLCLHSLKALRWQRSGTASGEFMNACDRTPLVC